MASVSSTLGYPFLKIIGTQYRLSLFLVAHLQTFQPKAKPHSYLGISDDTGLWPELNKIIIFSPGCTRMMMYELCPVINLEKTNVKVHYWRWHPVGVLCTSTFLTPSCLLPMALGLNVGRQGGLPDDVITVTGSQNSHMIRKPSCWLPILRETGSCLWQTGGHCAENVQWVCSHHRTLSCHEQISVAFGCLGPCPLPPHNALHGQQDVKLYSCQPREWKDGFMFSKL